MIEVTWQQQQLFTMNFLIAVLSKELREVMNMENKVGINGYHQGAHLQFIIMTLK